MIVSGGSPTLRCKVKSNQNLVLWVSSKFDFFLHFQKCRLSKIFSHFVKNHRSEFLSNIISRHGVGKIQTCFIKMVVFSKYKNTSSSLWKHMIQNGFYHVSGVYRSWTQSVCTRNLTLHVHTKFCVYTILFPGKIRERGIVLWNTVETQDATAPNGG